MYLCRRIERKLTRISRTALSPRFIWQNVNHTLLEQSDFPSLKASRRSTLVDENVQASYLQDANNLHTVMHYHHKHHPHVKRYMINNPDMVLRDADALTADIAMHYSKQHGIDQPPAFTARVYLKLHDTSIYLDEQDILAEPRLYIRPVYVSASGRVMIQHVAFFQDSKRTIPGFEGFYVVVNAKKVPPMDVNRVGEVWDQAKKQAVLGDNLHCENSPKREFTMLMPHEKNANDTVFGGYLTHQMVINAHTLAFESLLPFSLDKSTIYNRNETIRFKYMSIEFLKKTLPMQLCTMRTQMYEHSRDTGMISIRAVVESNGEILVSSSISAQYDTEQYSPPQFAEKEHETVSEIADQLLVASSVEKNF